MYEKYDYPIRPIRPSTPKRHTYFQDPWLTLFGRHPVRFDRIQRFIRPSCPTTPHDPSSGIEETLRWI